MTPRTTSPMLIQGRAPLAGPTPSAAPTPIEDPAPVAQPTPAPGITFPTGLATTRLPEIPATMAGLRTALTSTARTVQAAGSGAVADLYVRAAGRLSTSTDSARDPDGGPVPHHQDLDQEREDDQSPARIDALTSSCIDLAIAVLGNEAEPLTPAEVLAITNIVTLLCSARALIHGGQA